MWLQAPPAQPSNLPAPALSAAPLSTAGQLRALLAAIGRGLSWGLPKVTHELALWRANASSIRDPGMRADAISALDRKRGHAAGAALFAILPSRRDHNLLRLLVAYETIWDFLDTTSERAPDERNGRQLHLALIYALDPSRPTSNYYLYHPWDDGGYLADLVAACRSCCTALPAYQQVRPALLIEAWRAQVLALNHQRNQPLRDASLRHWAQSQAPLAPEATWYELSGAASASLTIHALLALAAQPACGTVEITQVRDAYNPWISAATTMLDSYVDQLEDALNDDHSYVSHYPSPQAAVTRTSWLIQQSLSHAKSLPNGSRHTVIVAAMTAMYLCKESAYDARLRPGSRTLARSGGPLTSLLIPLVRLWRIAYHQRAA